MTEEEQIRRAGNRCSRCAAPHGFLTIRMGPAWYSMDTFSQWYYAIEDAPLLIEPMRVIVARCRMSTGKPLCQWCGPKEAGKKLFG